MYKSFEKLQKDCQKCQKCELHKQRQNVVFGDGDKNAKVLFVGEAPGEQEDILAQPFVGRSGKVLDFYLESIGMSRNDVYITSIAKCRPPKNRDPKVSEQNACQFWLQEQIRLINPKIIVCLGRISASRLIAKDFKISQDHGKFFNINNIEIMATFHPAAILRNPKNKDLAMKDYLKLKEKIESLS